MLTPLELPFLSLVIATKGKKKKKKEKKKRGATQRERIREMFILSYPCPDRSSVPWAISFSYFVHKTGQTIEYNRQTSCKWERERITGKAVGNTRLVQSGTAIVFVVPNCVVLLSDMRTHPSPTRERTGVQTWKVKKSRQISFREEKVRGLNNGFKSEQEWNGGCGGVEQGPRARTHTK